MLKKYYVREIIYIVVRQLLVFVTESKKQVRRVMFGKEMIVACATVVGLMVTCDWTLGIF